MSNSARIYSAGRWVAGGTLLRALMQLLQTAVLARLLSPADFGEIALVAGATALAGLVAEFGVTTVILHYKELTRSHLSTLYWLGLGLALLVSALFCLLSAWIVPNALPLFDVTLLYYSSLTFPLVALGQQFLVLAQKEIRFAGITTIELLSVLATFASAVLMAVGEVGALAVVLATLVGAAVRSSLAILYLAEQGIPKSEIRFEEVRAMLGFASYRLAEALTGQFRAQTDVFVGSLYAGAQALGEYAVARNLAQKLTTAIINPAVTRISLPMMAKVQDDRAELQRVYLKTLGLSSALNYPVYLFFYIFSADVVAVYLGAGWSEAVFYLEIFALWGLLRSIGNLIGSLVYAVGHVRAAFWFNMAGLLMLIPVLVAGTRIGGVQGLAWGLLLFQLGMMLPAWRFLVRPACGATLAAYLGGIMPALAAAAVSAYSAWWILSFLDLAPLLRLLAGLVLMGSAYIGLSWWLNREWMLIARELLFIGGRT